MGRAALLPPLGKMLDLALQRCGGIPQTHGHGRNIQEGLEFQVKGYKNSGGGTAIRGFKQKNDVTEL